MGGPGDAATRWRRREDTAMAGRRGALIVLEGVDRAGKSTQGRKLVDALCTAGHRAELLRFPERSTEIGKLLSSYLEKKSEVEDHSVHLLFSANRWEQVPLIKEKLGQGITLVVDRYAFSGVAFTSAKENFSLDWCKQPDVGLPKPDLVVFLQLRLAEAAARSEFGQERYEDRAFQEQVLRRFHQLRGDTSLNWKVSTWCLDGRFSYLCRIRCWPPAWSSLRSPWSGFSALVSPPACASPSTCICAPCPPRLCCAVQLCCHGQAPCEKGPCAAPSTSWTSQSPPCAQMVDASRSIEEVHQEICTLSKDTIQAAAQRPLGELWK
ncbi:thymidylate kinase isoform X2 [Camelus dromedarius]|uniref:thymidylate kinase isoform X2 n=1 Tax=Camelus dromedarius TaxID=9838 RepID=UPI0031192A22